MLWLPLALPALVALLWVALPGLVFSRALGVRTLIALLSAAPVSIAIIALSAILAPKVGLSWGPLPVVLLTALLVAVAIGVRFLVRRVRPTSAAATPSAPAADRPSARARLVGWIRSADAMTLGALGLTAILMARHVKNILDTPDALSQSFDNQFHQNAVRYILDTGNGSSLTLMSMTAAPGDPQFYPAAWHDTVSLVLTTLGSDNIALATNAVMLAVLAFVWPASMLLMLRATLPTRILRYAILPAGVLMAAFPDFPFLLVGFGVLYPNLLGYALIPATLAFAAQFLGAGRLHLPMPVTITLGFFAALGMSLGHPNASMSFIVFLIAWCVAYAAQALVRRRRYLLALAYGGLGLAVFGIATWIWDIIRPPADQTTWTAFATGTQALGLGISQSAKIDYLSPLLLVLLVFIGVYASIRLRYFSYLFGWAAAMYLWWVVAAGDNPEARNLLTGVWYNDSFRIASLLALMALPLAALGVGYVLSRLAHLLPLRRVRSWVPVGLSALAAVALVFATQAATYMNTMIDWVSSSYQWSDESSLLTNDELALIEELPELVPEDAVIFTNPWTGDSLIYAYTGLDTTTKHTYEYVPKEESFLNDNLYRAASDPQVCTALEKVGADYVVVFERDQINGAQWPYHGVRRVPGSEGFTEIAREGDARLYRIDACGQ